MAYDEDVAHRIRAMLAGRSDVTERKMFGGLCFVVRGHMCCAASGRGGLLVRIGPDAPAAIFRNPHAAPMEMRGRVMAGYVRVVPEGYRTASGLKKWVTRAIDCVAKLPIKKTTKRPAARRAAKAKRTARS